MKGKLATVGLKLFIGFLFTLVYSTAFAQNEGSISPFGDVANLFRSGIYVISDGEFDVGNNYEERLQEQERNFGFKYHIDASTKEGHTFFSNNISSVPFLGKNDRHIRTGTILGYDAQGTDGYMVGSETISSATCGNNGGIGMSADVGFNITKGTISTGSNTQNFPYVAEFTASAVATGTLTTGVTAESLSFVEDGNGDYVEKSSANYSQGVTVSGKIKSFSQTSSMSLSGAGCGICW